MTNEQLTLAERWKRIEETHPEPTGDEYRDTWQAKLNIASRRIARVRAQRDLLAEALQQMLSAVSAGRFQIECDDVDGSNWFDARDAILATLKPSTEVPRE